MHNLVIRKGLTKRAGAAEDGPSFEQQFGILTNAVIADKLPQMDKMKLAFQLIKKSEDNSEACGVAIYMVGKNVIFVPATFKNSKLKTGDMFLYAATQQMLPLSDPWISWLKNKDTADVGELLPQDLDSSFMQQKGNTIREIADPLIKMGVKYVERMFDTAPDMLSRDKTNVMDVALAMGKEATCTLLDNMIKNANVLNAALTFYSEHDIDKFAKQASALERTAPEVELIMPLTKEAKTLNEQEMRALHKDGFFIRKVASEVPAADVIRGRQLSNMFSVVSDTGKAMLLQNNGDVKEVLVMRRNAEGSLEHTYDDCMGNPIEPQIFSRSHDPSMTAQRYMAQRGEKKGQLCVQASNNLFVDLPEGAMGMLKGRTPFSADMLEGLGKELTKSVGSIEYGSLLAMPNGTFVPVYTNELQLTEDKDGWTDGYIILTISKDPKLVNCMKYGNSLVVPQGTRIIMGEENNAKGSKPKHPITYVTLNTLDAFLTEFCNKRYNKTRVYSNGSEFTISGDTSAESLPVAAKEAALTLVRDYNVEPAVAKVMLKEANNGASYNNPRSLVYFVTKNAGLEWQDASMGYSEKSNEHNIESKEMPTILEDPAQLQQAVTNAAQHGIKEVFDVSAIKLMVQQNRFFDSINEDIPMFMQMLDSLCRKLFQFYWHTDKMEEKYGMVKMKVLEESLKVSLDSLSELTIFFKLRTVDGTGGVGDTTSELMGGNML